MHLTEVEKAYRAGRLRGEREAASRQSRSKALLDMLAGVDDGDQTTDMMRLAAEFLDDSGFGGPLAGKLRAKAERIEDAMSNAEAHGRRSRTAQPLVGSLEVGHAND